MKKLKETKVTTQRALLVTLSLLVINTCFSHPIKLSTAKLVFSGDKASLSIIVFWDDFRDHLISKYRYPISPDRHDQGSQKIILHYIMENFQLREGDDHSVLQLIDYKLKDDGISLQLDFEIDDLAPEKTISLKYVLLLDAFDNQSNVLSIIDEHGDKKIYRYLKGDDWKVLK